MKLESLNASASAVEFIRCHGLESEFSRVEDHLLKAFNGPEKVTVELIASPEDDGEGSERIVFTVKSDMDRQSFKRAIQDFFAPLRTSNSRLYPLISVTRDL